MPNNPPHESPEQLLRRLRKIECDEMTMHDVFTGFALIGLLSNPNLSTRDAAPVVRAARDTADEMLIQRSEQK